MLEHAAEGEGQEDEHCLVHQLGDNAEADETGVGHQVSRGGGRVAGDVNRAFDEPFGEATENGDQQIQDAGGSREALG